MNTQSVEEFTKQEAKRLLMMVKVEGELFDEDSAYAFITDLLTTRDEQVRAEASQIVSRHHYDLEEWFAHHDEYPRNTALFDAHQRSMKTRNAITRELVTPTMDVISKN